MRKRTHVLLAPAIAVVVLLVLAIGAFFLLTRSTLSVDVRVVSSEEFEQISKGESVIVALPEPLEANPEPKEEVPDGEALVKLPGKEPMRVVLPAGMRLFEQGVVAGADGFAVCETGCADVDIARYDSEGRLLWRAAEDCHAHALALLSTGTNRLYVYVFEWGQIPLLTCSVILEFDWATGARVGVAPLRSALQRNGLALDERRKVLYVDSGRHAGGGFVAWLVQIFG